MKNIYFKLFLLSLFSFLISACGGSDSTTNNNQATETSSPVQSIQPTAVNVENWQSARIINTKNPMANNVEIVGSELIIKVKSTDISDGAHLQVYLNTDAKPETGFRFEDEAWEESGVDYLIEDGDLFKSTANNTGWNWNINIGAIDYTINTDMAVAKIDLSLLGDICNNIKVGIMTRDAFWNISTFSPASSQMQNFNVSYCNTNTPDTVKPSLTLLGANPLKLEVNDVFTDPGATATDDVDGNITSRIYPKSTVNTAVAGTYEVSYLVSDIAGNSAKIIRIVIVSNVSLPDGIVIDGHSNDWSDIPNFSSSADGIMKVSDDEEKLYVLVTSSNLGENVQILIDTDNNSATGLELSAQVNAWVAGADYMVENNSLDKSKSNSGWSWDYGIAPIEFIKKSDTLEIAIKKSDFNQLANNIPMGYVSRKADWNVNYILPAESIPSYSLKFSTAVNPVFANNDSVTTTNEQPILIDVLANDNSASNSALTVNLPSQPDTGSASIVQNNVVYTPSPTFTGTVNFAYEISDSNGNKDTANIKVIVSEPIIEPPIAINDSANTVFNTPVTVNVLDNDSVTDGETLTIVSVTQPYNGTASISGEVIVYTPNSGFSGTDVLTYSISVGVEGSIAVATVTITVFGNNPPIVNNDSFTIDIGIQQSIIMDVLANDIDPDDDLLEITNVRETPIGIATITSDGKVLYSPKGFIYENLSVPYFISDGNGGTASGFFFLDIIDSTNSNPNASTDIIRTLQGQSVTFNVLSNDTDPDGDIISISSGVAYIEINGVISDNQNGNYTYKPNSGFVGIDSFTYGIGDGGSGRARGTVNITVIAQPSNTLPQANNDSATTIGINTKQIAVLNNDTDVDNDTLQVTDFSQANNGSVTLTAATSVLSYTPDATFSGTDIFTYTISDGNGGTDTATVTITVPQNTAPDAVEDSPSVFFDQTITVDVLANDTDIDNDVLTVVSIVQPHVGFARLNADGTIFLDPQNNVASISIAYTLSDGRGGSDIAVLTVASTDPNDGNDAYPDITNEYVTTPKNIPIFIDVLANDSDADGDVLILDQIDFGDNGTTEKINGGVRYTPDPGFIGTDIFYYGVHDGHGHNGAGFVEVTVTQ